MGYVTTNTIGATGRPALAETRVLSVTPSGPRGAEFGLYDLRLDNPGWIEAPAGSFAMLRPRAFSGDLLWARPFSIAGLDSRAIRFLVMDVGRGTSVLTRLSPGDPVTIWGPLGNALAVEPDAPTLILAGGVGLAPFLSYVRAHPNPRNLRLVFGHRPPLDCYPFAEAAEVVEATAFREEKPGDLDRFVALLEDHVSRLPTLTPPRSGTMRGRSDLQHESDIPERSGLVLACGPRPFLATVARLVRRYGLRGQVSLENRMACGVGACLGCVEPDASGQPVQVCSRGPVFWIEELALGREEKG